MHTYRRETRVRASLEDVWSFHATTDGLEALTPSFMGLTVESVTGLDGEADPEVLEAGSRIEVSMRPFGVGPERRWMSVITERTQRPGAAMFRDVMEEGPFPEWIHTHRFFDDDGETVIVDRVEYRLFDGRLGDAVGGFGRVGLELIFRHRHRRTKQLLE